MCYIDVIDFQHFLSSWCFCVCVFIIFSFGGRPVPFTFLAITPYSFLWIICLAFDYFFSPPSSISSFFLIRLVWDEKNMTRANNRRGIFSTHETLFKTFQQKTLWKNNKEPYTGTHTYILDALKYVQVCASKHDEEYQKERPPTMARASQCI